MATDDDGKKVEPGIAAPPPHDAERTDPDTSAFATPAPVSGGAVPADPSCERVSATVGGEETKREVPPSVPIVGLLPSLRLSTPNGPLMMEVTRQCFVIGRAPDCDLVIPDNLISRRHACIEQKGKRWHLVDLGSGNGTFLNKKPVKDAPLSDQDAIQVGDASMEFVWPVLDAADEPLPGSSDPTTPPALPQPDTTVHGRTQVFHRYRHRRLLLIAGPLCVLIGLLGMIKQWTKPDPEPPGPTPEEIAQWQQQEEEAKEAFVQARALIKQEKWTEALPLILQAAEIFPEDPMVLEYKASAQKEADIAKLLSSAKEKATALDWDGAIAELQKIPSDSLQASLAEELSRKFVEQRREHKRTLLKQAFESKDYPDAVKRADELLQEDPADETVQELKRKAEILSLRKGASDNPGKTQPVVVQPIEPKITTALAGAALAAYRDGEIDKTLQLAKEAGASADLQNQLRKLQFSLQRGKDLANDPNQSSQAEKFLTDALSLDRKFSAGQGKVSDSISGSLAKLYYVRAADAQARKNYAEAFKNYNLALRFKPDMKAAKSRIRDLEQQAKALYEAAYVFKNSQSEKSVSNCRTVLKMVGSNHAYYNKCKKLLRELQGSGDGEEQP